MKRDTRRSGQTMVEYIIIVVVIAIAALAVFGILGDTVKDKAGGAVTSLTTGDNATAAKDAADTKSIDKFKDRSQQSPTAGNDIHCRHRHWLLVSPTKIAPQTAKSRQYAKKWQNITCSVPPSSESRHGSRPGAMPEKGPQPWNRGRGFPG